MTTCGAPEPPPPVFGPVPSRHLGRSIGINNIPPKVCSFACVYCQVGPTLDRTIETQPFFEPEALADAVASHVARMRARGEEVDYLTFGPDGEPTLDTGLGEAIRLLHPLGIKVAVITNGTLLWSDDVRSALEGADWVSVNVDAVEPAIWRRINRPHPDLDFAMVRDGIARFAASFTGDLVSETMLVSGMNDGVDTVEAVGAFLSSIDLTAAYLSIPTRPTPYAAITAPDEQIVNRAYQALAEQVPHVEYLVGYEGDEFASSGDPRSDILSVTAVHPMRSSTIHELLDRAGASWGVIEDLVADGDLIAAPYRDGMFSMRRFDSRRSRPAEHS